MKKKNTSVKIWWFFTSGKSASLKQGYRANLQGLKPSLSYQASQTSDRIFGDGVDVGDRARFFDESLKLKLTC